MAFGFTAAGPSAAGAAGSNAAPSWSQVVSGTSTLLLAAIACDSDSTTITSMSYGAQAMTPLIAGSGNYIHSNGQTAGWVAVYKLLAATPGTANVTAVLSASSVWEGGSLAFEGADQVTGVGTPRSGTGAVAAPALAYTPNTSGNLIAAFLVNGNFISSATAPSTSRFINNTGGSNAGGHIAGETAPATGSSVSMAWAVTADWYAIMAVEVLAAGGWAAMAGSPAGAGAAGGPVIATSNLTSGPRYAGTAADLGGGAGSWATVQYATGPPT